MSRCHRAACAALLLAPLVLTAAPIERFEFSEPHMGTLVRLVLYAPNGGVAERAANAAFARVAALDETLSDYRDTSEVMRVSRASGGVPVEVSDDLFRVLRVSQSMARATGGAFDVTVGPLSILWRAARRHHELPDDESVTAARARAGFTNLELDESRRTVRLRVNGMQLDLGGIAKGFAADEAAVVLSRHGIASALIAAGGDIVAMDAPPGQPGWTVAIAGGAGASAGSVALRRAAVSTSGDAEQFVEIGGVRYSHIIDPRTGRALTGRSSVTVVAANGVTSDSLATAVSVMGAEKGMRLVNATEGAAALLVTGGPGGTHTYESKRWRAFTR